MRRWPARSLRGEGGGFPPASREEVRLARGDPGRPARTRRQRREKSVPPGPPGTEGGGCVARRSENGRRSVSRGERPERDRPSGFFGAGGALPPGRLRGEGATAGHPRRGGVPDRLRAGPWRADPAEGAGAETRGGRGLRQGEEDEVPLRDHGTELPERGGPSHRPRPGSVSPRSE